ncbi:MAG: thiamine pyrophosphate protein central region [Conexibacter sp.]|nr:thiamine pyrophosphate protein central region [Conexibacter sp.]
MSTLETAAPAATIRLTVGQAVVRYLSRQYSERDGIRRRAVPAMFGIFGHGNVCGLGQALDEEGHELAFLQAKNEQAMVHAAIGYAKAHDRLATLACTASIGPGATNLATGAATATVNRVPVLLLPADTFATRLQGPPMQALDDADVGDLTVNDCLRPVSRFFDRVARPEQLLEALPAAMRALLDPERAGAVTLCLHQDVQAEAYDFPAGFFAERTWHVPRRPPEVGELERAVAAIARAERPLIVAGGGVHYSDATDALRAFSDAFAVPVAETSAGKGAGVGCELGVGAIGHSGTRAANRLAGEADLVLCLGTRLIDLTTGSNTLFADPDVRFVHVNLAPGDANKLGALPLLSDVRSGLHGLSAPLAEARWSGRPEWAAHARAAMSDWRADVADDLAARPAERISQGQALRVLNEQAQPRDALVVASGTPHVDVHRLWDCGRGGRVYMEVGFSCMGHEIPAALGVRIGDPNAGEVYAVIGDGTYMMGHSELVTAVQEGLKITVVLIENHGYQSIHALQRSRTGRSFGLEFRARTAEGLTGGFVDVDLVANARSYGCATWAVETTDELRDALAAAREQPRAAVIVVRVDPLRLTLSSDCWWDVGVPEVSGHEETRAAAAATIDGRRAMRWYG